MTTLKLKTKEGVTREGYITINPTSTYTDSQERCYAFTQSTGGTSCLVQPDMNGDGVIAGKATAVYIYDATLQDFLVATLQDVYNCIVESCRKQKYNE